MKRIERIEKKLDKAYGQVWRRRCASDTGVSYWTVLNVLKGDSQNRKVKDWIADELEEIKMIKF